MPDRTDLRALLRPQTLLIAAIVLLPITTSLSGDPHLGATAAFGLSDVLLLLALPWVIAQAWRRARAAPAPHGPAQEREPPSQRHLPPLRRVGARWGEAGRLFLPVLLYVAAGLLSFCLNLPAMRGHTLSYFMGFLRTVQIVLVLPLTFAALPWRSEDIRAMLRGYLLVCAALAGTELFAFLIGLREGDSLYGMQKNGIGLSLAVAALIAFAALTQPPASAPDIAARSGLSSRSLCAILGLCVLALDCVLARGAFLSLLAGLCCVAWMHRCWRAAAVVAISATLALLGVLLALPKDSANYYRDFSETMPSRFEREEQLIQFRQAFPSHWLLGDGFRARRDYLPHNLELTLLAENGVVGAALFLWALAAQLQGMRAGRRALARADVPLWFCTALIAVSAAILMHAQFDPYWRRGPLWLPWAGAGLLIALLRPPPLTPAPGAAGESAPDHVFTPSPVPVRAANETGQEDGEAEKDGGP